MGSLVYLERKLNIRLCEDASIFEIRIAVTTADVCICVPKVCIGTVLPLICSRNLLILRFYSVKLSILTYSFSTPEDKVRGSTQLFTFDLYH